MKKGRGFAYEPNPLFHELANWVRIFPQVGNPKAILSTADAAYRKASQAAFLCGQDREKNLKILLNAKEPVVRVAGAVYRCFENEKLGKVELANLTKEPGEAGSWAALTLARRGDKKVVVRLLELFHKDGPSSYMQINQRYQAMVLLSNSAQKSGVPQPPAASFQSGRAEFDIGAMIDWWRLHTEKITLHDPWMETLSKQKID